MYPNNNRMSGNIVDEYNQHWKDGDNFAYETVNELVGVLDLCIQRKRLDILAVPNIHYMCVSGERRMFDFTDVPPSYFNENVAELRQLVMTKMRKDGACFCVSGHVGRVDGQVYYYIITESLVFGCVVRRFRIHSNNVIEVPGEAVDECIIVDSSFNGYFVHLLYTPFSVN